MSTGIKSVLIYFKHKCGSEHYIDIYKGRNAEGFISLCFSSMLIDNAVKSAYVCCSHITELSLIVLSGII